MNAAKIVENTHLDNIALAMDIVEELAKQLFYTKEQIHDYTIT